MTKSTNDSRPPGTTLPPGTPNGDVRCLIVPLRAGQWAAQFDVDSPVFGTIKDSYPEEGMIDLVVYDWRGNKIGRVSPPMGGPTTFEPCCEAANYRRIEKPTFPMERNIYGNPVFGWHNAKKKVAKAKDHA